MKYIFIHSRNHLSIFKKSLLLCGLFLFSINAFAQFTYSEDLRGEQPSGFIVGSAAGSDDPYFTSGIDDPFGAGWLRLTKAAFQQNGYVYIDRSFPSTMGVVVEFEYKMWRHTNHQTDFWGLGGDGFSFFLFDADIPSFGLGAYGGSLGYAQRWNAGNQHPNQPGLAGGYIGVGFDMFGYFATATEGKIGGLDPDPINQFDRIPNTVSLRGITTDFPETNSNIFLDGIKLGDRSLAPMDQVQQPGLIGYHTPTSTRPTDAQMYRRVQIRVNPLPEGGYEVRVAWKKSNTPGPFQHLITYNYTEAPPANLKLGFAGASNSAINNHEIRGLQVTTPNNLRVNKLANKDLLRSVPSTNNANQITYTIEVVNESDQAYTNAAFLDEMVDLNGDPISTDMFDITNISPTGFTNTSLAQVAGQNTISGTVSIAANTTAYVQVTGSLNQIPYNNQLINNVSVLPAAGDEDFDLTNNYASLTIPVIAENVDLMLLKNPTGDPCLDEDGITYELRVTNMGAANATYRRPRGDGNRIVVIKEVPAEYTYSDSGTSFSTSPTNTGSTRWYKATETISSGYTGYGDVEFPTGGTRYYYVAKYPTRSWEDQTLVGNGGVYETDYPIVYTITPPEGDTSFEDIARVEYRTGNSSFNGSGDLGIDNIEPSENLHNNTNTQTVSYINEGPEVIEGNTIYYTVGDTASPLTAEAQSGNTLLWYLSEDGVPLSVAPTPSTEEVGTTRFYVRQTNGDCYSPFSFIDVIVEERAGKLMTNPMIRQRVK